VETPGKSLLPPLSSLTSPQPLLNGGTPGWPSLRSGPLSPAMLTGPAGGNDYFDQSFSRGFPTPNESSLRSGLTPGGGGSMFPAPSPNSQALFNSLQSGGATPSTLDFYRTSLGAKAAAQGNNFAPTSQPTDPSLQQNMERSQQQQQQQQPAQQQQEQYNQHHPDQDAVNGLYMLAQANTGGMRNGNQFAVPSQSVQTSMAPMQSGAQSQDTSPVSKRNLKNSIGSMSMSGQTDGFSDSAGSEQATKPTTRSRGKKAAGGKANNRRKADDQPAKAPANKRAKANNGSSSSAVQDMMMMSDDDDDQAQSEMIDTHPNGKKMTDEEKRKNFLERNRYVFVMLTSFLIFRVRRFQSFVFNLPMCLKDPGCTVERSQVFRTYRNRINNMESLKCTQCFNDHI
jgi:ATF/CREB family transcription factor